MKQYLLLEEGGKTPFSIKFGFTGKNAIHKHEDMDYLLQDRVLKDTLLSTTKHEHMHFMHVCLYSMFTISYPKHHTKITKPNKTVLLVNCDSGTQTPANSKHYSRVPVTFNDCTNHVTF